VSGIEVTEIVETLSLAGNTCERGRGEIVCLFRTEEGEREDRGVSLRDNAKLRNCSAIGRLVLMRKRKKEREKE